MQAARLFHLRGNATDDAGKPIKFDIHFGPHRAAGSITQSGSELDLINPGGASVYFKAPDSVWKQQGGDAAVALFHDRWVKVPANDKRFAELVTSFAKESFIAELTSDDSDAGDLRKIGDATVDGMPAVEYESSDHTHIYVAASGSPVLLKIVKSGSDSGTITFSDYNKPYPFQPPPAEQTIDFAKLEQR